MKVKQVKTRKKEGAAAGFRAARQGKQSNSAAFNPIALLSRSTEEDYPQAKMKIGSPGDIYEQEADQTAEQVMNIPGPVTQRQREEEEQEEPIQATKLIQRQAEEEEEAVQEKSLLHRQVEPVQAKKDSGGTVGSGLQSQLMSTKGSGNLLSEHTRGFMEPRFGRDFGNVKVHTDNNAVTMSKELGAQAFTHGSDIYFNEGKHNPDTSSGKQLLAHELTHTIQQGAIPIAKGQTVQRSGYRTARQRGQSGNPINVAVQAVRGNYSEIGATWLTTHLVAGIIYAEGDINMDVLDVIGDAVGASDSVGPGQLESRAIQQVDTSIPQAAHQQFERQFGAAPATWREKAEHNQWAYFYTAGYLAWCMTRAASIFQAVDGADSHIPLGFAMYKGAFNRMRDLRREIAGERSIPFTDVTWEMIEEAAGRGASRRRLDPRTRQAFEYAQLGVGFFDFEFRINEVLESRSFHVPEGHVKVFCSADYTDSNITPAPEDSYYVQLLELQMIGQYSEFPTTQLVRHDRVRYRIGSRQVYEWTRLPRGSTYAVKFTNENPNEIRGSGEVKYLY